MNLRIALLTLLYAFAVSSLAQAQDANPEKILKKTAFPKGFVFPSGDYKAEWIKHMRSVQTDESSVGYCESRSSGKKKYFPQFERFDVKEIVFDNLCISELTQLMKDQVLDKFRADNEKFSPYSYLTADNAKHLKLVYLSPVFACNNKEDGDDGKIRKKFYAGFSSDAVGVVGGQCHNQLTQKGTLRFKFGFEEVPGEGKDYLHFKADLAAVRNYAEEMVRDPLKGVLGHLDGRIKNELETLKARLNQLPPPRFVPPPSDGPEKQNVAIFVDNTGSTKDAYEQTVKEIIQMVEHYPENKSISISFFGYPKGAELLTNDMILEKGKMLLATKANKQKIIEWLKQPRPHGMDIENEFAAASFSAVKNENPKVPTDYILFGDGKNSINVKTKTEKTDTLAESERQKKFVQELPKTSTFTFSPMTPKKFNADYVSYLGGAAKLRTDNQGEIIDTEKYYSERSEIENRIEKAKVALSQVTFLKSQDFENGFASAFKTELKTLQSAKSGMKSAVNYNENEKITNGIKESLLGKPGMTGQFEYLERATIDLPEIISTYGEDKTIDLGVTKARLSQSQTKFTIKSANDNSGDEYIQRIKVCK